jgi:hypothetical protein
MQYGIVLGAVGLFGLSLLVGARAALPAAAAWRAAGSGSPAAKPLLRRSSSTT